MAKTKFDGVVEAVHYKPDGQVDWVRTYMRRGPTWSDYVLLDRQTLIGYLKSGKVFMIGKRVPQMAGTFEVSKALRLMQSGGNDVLVVGDAKSDKDCLDGVPRL